jgi:hypothetical protein
MKGIVIAAALAVLWAGSLHAQMSKSDLLIQRLASPSSEMRKSVSSDMYGSGVTDKVTMTAIAEVVAKELPSITPTDERADEVAWHLKALASSGDEQYRSLIEQAVASPNQHVAEYASSALKTLDLTSKTGFPLLTRDKVRQITDRQAESCVLIRTHECASMRGNDTCLSELRYQAIEAGGDSFMLMTSEGRGWLGRVRMTADLYNCRGNFTKADEEL